MKIDQTIAVKSHREGLQRGFLAVVPFWLGVAPFAIAFAVAASSVNLSPVETQLMSLLIFSGAGQMAAVALLAGGSGVITISLTVLIINLRHVIYALALDQQLPDRPVPPRPILAFFLIDESFGLSMSQRDRSIRFDAFFLGASLSIYVPFVMFTAVGILLGQHFSGIQGIGLDFVFPLVFVALLIPMLTGPRQIVVALVSGLTMLALSMFVDPGLAILVAICTGAGAGAYLGDNKS